MKIKYHLPALALLLAAGTAANQELPPPNSNSDRPGADMQGNLGTTIWDPATAMNMNAESNPPPLPPGLRDPTVTKEEEVNVNPLGEPRGPGAPNISVATPAKPSGK